MLLDSHLAGKWLAQMQQNEYSLKPFTSTKKILSAFSIDIIPERLDTLINVPRQWQILSLLVNVILEPSHCSRQIIVLADRVPKAKAKGLLPIETELLRDDKRIQTILDCTDRFGKLRKHFRFVPSLELFSHVLLDSVTGANKGNQRSKAKVLSIKKVLACVNDAMTGQTSDGLFITRSSKTNGC
ncbi:hypothetical protein HG531_005368 [Fusarium graminearum]|nr:hypothetical protein HG531_005368 [Fusarium graminearum]